MQGFGTDSFDQKGAKAAGSVASSGGQPSIAGLSEIFDQCKGGDCLKDDQRTLEKVILVLNEKYQVGFSANDVASLRKMLSKDGKIERPHFTATLFSLLQAVGRASEQLSLRQLRVVMVTAFQRFDLDADGCIAPHEFAAALQNFGIRLPLSEIAVLLKFLSPMNDATETGIPPVLRQEDLSGAVGMEPSLEDQCTRAISGAQDKVCEATGLSRAAEVCETISGICAGQGDPMNKANSVFKAVADADFVHEGGELIADLSDLMVLLAGVAVVFMHPHSVHAVHETGPFLQQMAVQAGEAAEDCVAGFEELAQSGPLIPVLMSGVLGASKALWAQGTVSLDEDEALLYARTFLDKGCSLHDFHKLVHCAGCKWGHAEPGQSLFDPSSTAALAILVRGEAVSDDRARVSAGSLLSPQSSGEVVAAEPVTYVAWDEAKLVELLQYSKDKNVVALLEKLIQEGHLHVSEGYTSPAQDAPVPEWLSSIRDVIKLHAKRSGLSDCGHVSEGLQHILAKPATSIEEKFDQSRTLILDSLDQLVDGLEAVTDLVGACSSLSALVTQSSSASPDNVLQLAPLLILSSLAVLQTVVRMTRSNVASQEKELQANMGLHSVDTGRV